MHDTGVIHGRFQVLHHDHLHYLRAGKARCEHLVVGITNPDPLLTREDPADPLRGSPRANPLTYFERYTMIRAALLDVGLADGSLSIVPFPINFPELYHHYLPLEATFFLTIYDCWGRRKLEMFQARGLKTEILWERPIAEKGLSATDVRRRMAEGEPWEHLVPASTASLMHRWGVPSRLGKLRTS
jgi:nicotinamide mononucleotide adenylyltransferase